MPRRNTKKSSNKRKPRSKKHSKKRGPSKSRFMGRSNGPFVVPPRMRVKMIYKDIVLLNDSSSSTASIRYRPTSAYDLDPTVGGHSYYGYSEFSKFYNKYRVHSSKITVIATNRDAESHILTVLPIQKDPGANVSDYQKYSYNSNAHSRVIPNYQSTPKGTVRHAATTRKMLGVTDFAEDTAVADVDQNPVENWFWFVGTEYVAGSMTYGLRLLVTVETWIDFMERTELSDPSYMLSHPPPTKSDLEPEFPPLTRTALVSDPDNAGYAQKVQLLSTSPLPVRVSQDFSLTSQTNSNSSTESGDRSYTIGLVSPLTSSVSLKGNNLERSEDLIPSKEIKRSSNDLIETVQVRLSNLTLDHKNEQ